MTARWLGVNRRRSPSPWSSPRHWKLWTVPRPFLAYVFVVVGGAVAAIVLTAGVRPVERVDLGWFAVLAGLSVVHLEANRGIERMRELATEGRTYVVLMSIWTFGGLLVLPPPLVAALIVVTYTHSWLRTGQHVLPHRWTFSAATIVLASAAGGAVLAMHPAGYPVLPTGWSGIGIVVAAAVARWLVNSVLIVVALPLMTPNMAWRQAFKDVFGTPGDDLIEFASLSLGAGVALVLVTDPAWLVLFALPVLVLHRGLQLRQFEDAARHDRESGLLQTPVWRELAVKQLERARRLGLSVGYLLIRLDAYPAVVDRHGMLAGARVLRAVADTVRSQTREDDLLGRLPVADLVVLIPGVATIDELRRIADRVRDAAREVVVPLDGSAVVTTTVSIGGALFPEHATSLGDLLLRADNALFLAKTYGRDQVRLAGPRHVSQRLSAGVRAQVESTPGGSSEVSDPSSQ